MKLISFMIYFNFFCPLFYNFLGSQGLMITSLGVIGISYLILFRVNKIKYDKGLIFILNLLILLYLISPLLNKESILKDYLQVYKPILFLCTYLVGRNVDVKDIGFVIKKLEKVYIIFMVILIVYLVFPYLYNELALFYTKPQNIFGIRRLTTTFPNPYDYAYYLNFMLIYYYFKLKNEVRIKNLLFLVLGLVSLIYTYSRTGLIILVLNVSMVKIIKFYEWLKKGRQINLKKIALKICMSFLIVILIYNFNLEIITFFKEKFPYIYYGLESLFVKGVKDTPSIGTRFEQYKYVKESLEHNIFFGSGPYDIKQIYTESMYALYLFRYGVLGLLYVLFLLLYTISFSLKVYLKDSKTSRYNSFILAILVLNISNIIGFFTNNYIDQIRNNYLFYFLLGIILNINSNQKMSGEFNEKNINSWRL